jgi:hypothetical protein
MFAGQVAVELGTLLEFEDNEGHVVKGGRAKLLWFPKPRALGFFERVSASTASPDEVSGRSGSAEAIDKFRTWSDREFSGARELKFRAKNPKWYRGHLLSRIDYRSDKWGESAEYTHDFGPGVRLYLLSGSAADDGAALWVMKGGRLTVTARGIVG